MSISLPSDAPRPAGVILAGGLSRRMFAADRAAADCPRDKTLLPIGATTMLERVITRIGPQVSSLALNANGDPVRFSAFGLPVLADTVSGFVGPLAGVLAGMRWASRAIPHSKYVITVSSDAPFLPVDLVERLVTTADQRPGTIALAQSGDELHPVIGCWPADLADDLERALHNGVRKVLAWTDVHGTMPVLFPFARVGNENVDPFFNANTPEELGEARRLIALETT